MTQDKTTAALKLAEEALLNTGNALMVISAGRNIRQLYGEMRDDAVERCNKALAAIREALAEQSLGEYHGKLMREVCNKVITETLAEQEPVAWVSEDVCEGQYIDGRTRKIWWECKEGIGMAIYAAPVSAPEHNPIPFGQPGSREGFPPLEPLETLAYPLKECRHCGWLCTPNSGQSKKFYPLPQEPLDKAIKNDPLYLQGRADALEEAAQAVETESQDSTRYDFAAAIRSLK